MSVSGSQQRTLLLLLDQLQPHWRRDRNLPSRIQILLSRQRSFGSRDRRLYRELIYTALRFLPWIEPLLEQDSSHAVRVVAWLSAETAATTRFRQALIADWPSCPATVSEKAELLNHHPALHLPGAREIRPYNLLPSWAAEECPATLDPVQLDALHTRAPLWLRLNHEMVGDVTAEFTQLGWRWQISSVLPNALQMLDEVDVTKTVSYNNGWFEVQDLASQLLLASAEIEPGQTWLDACAGAGGKTLQLGGLLGPTGRVDAFDIRRAALDELAERAARAQLKNVTILEQRAQASYDGVLVDAPCTGSGTWRRAPHLKWTTTGQQIATAAVTQQTLLGEFSERVRPGGRLLYATCSLNRSENSAVVSDFLKHHVRFELEPPHRHFHGVVADAGLTLLPGLHNTDGFFIAAFRRRVETGERILAR